MATTKSVPTRSAAISGPGTVAAHSATVATQRGYSLHDCPTPDQAGAHNEIWPRGAGQTVVFNQGLVVHTADHNNVGTVSVTVR